MFGGCKKWRMQIVAAELAIERKKRIFIAEGSVRGTTKETRSNVILFTI
jgi:hypothetical protein